MAGWLTGPMDKCMDIVSFETFSMLSVLWSKIRMDGWMDVIDIYSACQWHTQPIIHTHICKLDIWQCRGQQFSLVAFISEAGWLRLMDTTWAWEMTSTCRRQMCVERAGTRYRNAGVSVYMCFMWVCVLVYRYVCGVYHCLIERKSRKHFPFLQVLFTSPSSHAQKYHHYTQNSPQMHTNTHTSSWKWRQTQIFQCLKHCSSSLRLDHRT